MNRKRLNRILAGIAALVLLLLTPAPVHGQNSWATNQGTFSGYWGVSGTVHILEFTDGETVASGYLSGTVTFNSSQGRIGSLETECVMFTDEAVGSVGRCVWTNPTGDIAYVVLDGSGPAGLGRVRGEFVGGTGNLKGITGRFSYEWNYNVSGGGADATLDGYTLQMHGSYRLPGR